MTDLSKIQDDTPPEEYERRERERAEQLLARRKEESDRASAYLSQQMYASGQKEAQLQRIEDKLDRILSILGDGK